MAEHVSEEVANLLDSGVTIPQIARLFKTDARTVRAKIGHMTPYNTRDGVRRYLLRDVAGYLVPIPADIVDRVMRLNHTDLPAMLKKEYWIGQAQRLKVQEIQGDYWPTKAVMDYIGSMAKDVRMEIMLAGDRIERDTVLSERQRDAIKVLLDGLMQGIRGKLTQTFQRKREDPDGYSAAGEREPATRNLTIAEQVADL